MEALRLWTPYSRWKYREPREYPRGVARPMEARLRRDWSLYRGDNVRSVAKDFSRPLHLRRRWNSREYSLNSYDPGRVVGKPYLGIASHLPVIRPRSANTRRHIVTKLALHIRGRLPGVSLN